ncbi:DgyrCDS6109 [Dimorphilus gyrociliatus]|uniref:Late endosomal/lysosomal adaptor and MAPK and MTOR activator 4 n=1 Tax=Dimorphilus gyrociliatus TaxID=2664684 RepID=A0A7I8VM10_9ANNE|nr:DgyrCDS6109 [Dimorphilus gyrociliatus]
MVQGLEGVKNSLGHLVIDEDGAVQHSSGELENDENSANIFMDIVKIALSTADKTFKRLCIVWCDVSYVITISNYKIYVVKRPTQEYIENPTV